MHFASFLNVIASNVWSLHLLRSLHARSSVVIGPQDQSWSGEWSPSFAAASSTYTVPGRIGNCRLTGSAYAG